MNRDSNELYSILTRTTNLVSSTSVNAALNYYSSENAKTTLTDFIRENPALAISILAIILALIVIIIIQNRFIVLKRRADESQHQVEDLSKQVFIDALTHVRNKGGYDNYIGQLQARIDQGETIEVAIGVFDCDNLKGINDRYGHEKGNLYLQASSSLICRVFQHSPVFRIGGDEFVVLLLGEDYENRDRLFDQFEEEQKALSSPTMNQWEQVSIASGVAVYDPINDQSIRVLASRADKLMYENKRMRKEAVQRQRH